MTRVLSIASECAPLVKTGGLADVAGALPAALAAQGVQMRTLLPGYPAVMEALRDVAEVYYFHDLFGAPARVLAGQAAGLDLLAIDAPHLYARPGNPYMGPDGHDWPDNPERFAALSWVGAHLGVQGALGWHPQVLHGHDWQAGFVTEYLRQMGGGPATVLTIHNIAFTGATDPGRIGSLRLDPWRFRIEGYEFYGGVSALKAGLMGADALTTVSPTYAAELMTPEYGMGLDGVMRHRREALTGILNGIDESWDPRHCAQLAQPFGAGDWKGKQANADYVRRQFGLAVSRGPIFGLVARLVHQKGVDLVLSAADEIIRDGGQIVVTGSGEPAIEDALVAAHRRRPDAIGVIIGFNDGQARRIFAGSDFTLMPSRFEPCGLSQMYAQRFGSLPIGHQTGGLAETIADGETGFEVLVGGGLGRGVALALPGHHMDQHRPVGPRLDRPQQDQGVFQHGPCRCDSCQHASQRSQCTAHRGTGPCRPAYADV